LPWFDPYAETNPASHSVERKTSMTASLTVAIPTFNRSRDAARLAGQIAPWTEDGDRPVHAVFYDDGSSDDTYARLQRYGRDNLRILRNDTNQGYARTLIRALSECDTEWVMLVADDDVFAPDPRQLQALMTWLHEEDPDFVCTQWLTSDGRLYRGRNSTEPIPDKSLRQAASHAPGAHLPVCFRAPGAADPAAGAGPRIGRGPGVPAGRAPRADDRRGRQGHVLVGLTRPGGVCHAIGHQGRTRTKVLVSCFTPVSGPCI
jgi:hypothetical protein